jgi:ABC-type dipeptide/oligopeptide/nickel transport system permease component
VFSKDVNEIIGSRMGMTFFILSCLCGMLVVCHPVGVLVAVKQYTFKIIFSPSSDSLDCVRAFSWLSY